MKKGIAISVLLIAIQLSWAQFSISSGKAVTVTVDKSEAAVVHTALALFSQDI